MAASTVPDAVDLHLLERACAERDAALEMLDRMERAFPGGHSSHEVQSMLREARAMLVDCGVRKSDAPPVWRDRR